MQVNELEDSRYANAFPLPSEIGLRPTEGGQSALPSGVKKKPKTKVRKIGRGKPVKSVLVSENFDVIKNATGFTVKQSATTKIKKGDKFEIKAGYDLSAGNPLSNSKVDFEIANRLLSNSGVSIVSNNGNFMTLSVDNIPFECVFDNFHTYRDLVVAVNDVY